MSALELLPERLDLEPEGIERGLARLVLSIVELLREVMERQAIRRVEVGDLTDEEVERLGLGLLRLNEQLELLRETFGLTEEDLELKLRVGGAGAGTDR